jgi:phosphoglycerate kinase
VKKVDKLIIGGGMSYTFQRAKGFEVGLGLIQADKLKYAQSLLNDYKDKIILPLDAITVASFDFKTRTAVGLEVHNIDDIPPNREPVDIGFILVIPQLFFCNIGPKSRELFTKIIKNAKTVVWNGPMGVFEVDSLAEGTFAIAKALAEVTARGTITVC